MGLKKTVLCIGGLMMAAGGPVTVFSTSDLVGNIKRTWSANTTATASASSQSSSSTASSGSAADANSAGLAITAPTEPASAMPMPSLAEVLRFDVTVPWVMQSWPRVSTGLPYLQLQGYRVPLVTGTSVADMAGSLTYYFNSQQQVERIAFRGATGDPRVLVGMLSSRYHFARRLTNDPGVVLYEAVDSSNQRTGALKIRSAPVIKANQPYTRFEVDLVLDRAE